MLLSGGRGSGKSHGIGEAFAYYTYSLPYGSTLVVGQKHYKSVANASYKNIKDKIEDLGISDHFKFWKSPYKIVNTLTNTSIVFVGLDNGASLKSIEDVTYLWMEEADQITEDDFRTINLSLRNEGAIVFLSWNPGSPYNYIKEYFLDNEFRQNYIHIHTTYLENPFLPDDFIEEMEILKKYNYKLYLRDGLGQYIQHEGVIFDNYKVMEFDYSKVNTLLGRDFGFNDTDATVEVFIDINGDIPTLYICNELGFNGKTNTEILAEYKKSKLFKPKKQIICDSANPDKILECVKNKVPAIGVSKSQILKQHQLEIMQGWNIVLHPQCKQTIKEFNNYSWAKNKKTGQLLDEPEDGNDHFIDATRYSISKIMLSLVKNSTLKAKYIRGL